MKILLMMNDSLCFLSLVSVSAKFIDTGGNNLRLRAETERRTTSAVDLGKPSCKRSGRGRPSFDIPPASLEELRGLGFTWTRIAKMLNVSRSTIHRRVTDHGLEALVSFQT